MPNGRGKERMAKTSGNRVSIYVPADLKRRMDKTKEDVNWSALACDAFKAKLGELAQRKDTKNMSDVIERLRATEEAESSEAQKDGLEHGRDWVERSARVPELRKLRTLMVDKCNGDLADWLSESSAYSNSERLALAILGLKTDRHGAREFWKEAIGDADYVRIDDVDWLEGFVDGALELWEQLESQL